MTSLGFFKQGPWHLGKSWNFSTHHPIFGSASHLADRNFSWVKKLYTKKRDVTGRRKIWITVFSQLEKGFLNIYKNSVHFSYIFSVL